MSESTFYNDFKSFKSNCFSQFFGHHFSVVLQFYAHKQHTYTICPHVWGKIKLFVSFLILSSLKFRIIKTFENGSRNGRMSSYQCDFTIETRFKTYFIFWKDLSIIDPK